MNETSEQNWDTLEVERTINNDEFLYNFSREQAQLYGQITFNNSLYEYMVEIPYLDVSWDLVNWGYIRDEILDEQAPEE